MVISSLTALQKPLTQPDASVCSGSWRINLSHTHTPSSRCTSIFMCTHIEFVGIWGLLSHEVRENGIDKGWKFGTLNLTEWIRLFLRLFILPLLNIEKLLNKAAEKILPTYFSIPWNCHFNCNAWRECLGQKKTEISFHNWCCHHFTVVHWTLNYYCQ